MEQIIDNSKLKVGDCIIITPHHGGDFVGATGRIEKITVNAPYIDINWVPLTSRHEYIRTHIPYFLTISPIKGTEDQVTFKALKTVNTLGNFPRKRKTKKEVLV
jgi:hypothetical protein